MEAVELRRPEHFEEHPETLMSNFDNSIDSDVAEAIKDKPLYAQYAGWNFCGYVWWQNEEWHCEVWVYHTYQKTVTAETLREIMDKVSSEYGYD